MEQIGNLEGPRPPPDPKPSEANLSSDLKRPEGNASPLPSEVLHGDGKMVPLRELIQNAVDAERARQIYDRKGDQTSASNCDSPLPSRGGTVRRLLVVVAGLVGLVGSLAIGLALLFPLLIFLLGFFGYSAPRRPFDDPVFNFCLVALFEAAAVCGVWMFSKMFVRSLKVLKKQS